MLDQLLNLAEGPLEEMLAGMNQPNPKSSVNALKESVLSSLQKQVASGNLDVVKEMFSGKETAPSAPVITQLKGDVTEGLIEKLGITKEQALSIAAAALPMILNFFNKRVNDAPQDNQDIMSSILASLQGKSGKVNPSDLLGSLIGGGKNGGMDLGGLMDLGKGLFN